MKCFYHRDLDGKCAAAIVLHSEPECQLIPVDYRAKIPVENVEKDEEVVIVDFSFPVEEDWKRLLQRTEDVVWIDHHETAIRKSEALKIDHLPGLRRVGESGCLLTWKWFRQENQVPKAIELINRWDLWTHHDDPEVVHFVFGLKVQSTHPSSGLWETLFRSDEAIAAIQSEGRIIEAYERKRDRGYLHAFGFEAEFEGYRCLACNLGLGSSKLFESRKDRGYDIFISFVYDGGTYSVFLFSEKVKVNDLAEKYGGGGHAGAAGFTCADLPFSRVGKRPGRSESPPVHQ